MSKMLDGPWQEPTAVFLACFPALALIMVFLHCDIVKRMILQLSVAQPR